jgi:hypothetical protein
VIPVWVYSGTGQFRATVTVAASGVVDTAADGSSDAVALPAGAGALADGDGVAAPPQPATTNTSTSGIAAGFSAGRNRFTDLPPGVL